ncbi:MAG: site-specific DNA recombinase, partial [Rhodococcus sp. (in: high G+C Gram-positive bacteria)]
ARPVVELPGIEPGSYVESLGLLRVQFAKSLLGSPSLANKPG